MKKFLCYDTNDAATGKINVDSRGMLKPNSTVPSTNGASYQYLVTDGSGNTKWEDRLAYEKSRVVVDVGADISLVKVADEVPSLAIADKPVTIYFYPEGNFDGVVLQLGNTLLGVIRDRTPMVVMALTDNCEIGGGVLLEKGVYFYNAPESHVNRCVIDGTLEFTWDGSLYAPKQIDEKFIPKTNPNIPKNYKVVFEKTSSNVFQCNCTYSELKDFAVAGYPIYGVLLDRIVPTDTFQSNLIMVENAVDGHQMKFEFATGEGGATRLYYYEDGHISNEAPIG